MDQYGEIWQTIWRLLKAIFKAFNILMGFLIRWPDWKTETLMDSSLEINVVHMKRRIEEQSVLLQLSWWFSFLEVPQVPLQLPCFPKYERNPNN